MSFALTGFCRSRVDLSGSLPGFRPIAAAGSAKLSSCPSPARAQLAERRSASGTMTFDIDDAGGDDADAASWTQSFRLFSMMVSGI